MLRGAMVGCIVMLAIGGCAGDTPTSDRSGGDEEISTEDNKNNKGDQAACSAEGTAASCDPVANVGCGDGACYVVKGKGPACVCPAGSITAGKACDTTIDCAPQHVCAGTQAPGTCRRTCDPAALEADCPVGMFCQPIDSFPEHGFCKPKQ